MAAFPRMARNIFAIAVLVASLDSALAQRVGVSTAVNPDASGTPPGAAPRQLVIGQDVIHDERITTGPSGQSQLLFIDESAMTIGPSSDLTIDDFVYDPNAGTGKLAMSATRGVFRYVGGKVSKLENAVTLQTPSATIGVRGGVFVANVSPEGGIDVIFLYGKGLTVTASGVTQSIIRPGFAITVAGHGAAPSTPAPAPSSAVATLLGQLNGRSGASGGAKTPPTDANIAGIASTVSSNIAASVRQAAQNLPVSATAPAVNISTLQTSYNTSTVASQGNAVVVQAAQNPTRPGTPISSTTTNFNGTYPLIEFFSVNSASSLSAFGVTTGTVTHGILTNTGGSGGDFGSFPLAVGTANFGPGGTTSCAGCGPLTGTSFLSADGSFFYAAFTSPTDPKNQVNLLFGGIPTVSLPASGVGNYSGSAVGAVNNNGATYQASGTFTASYNFGSAAGSFALSKLDGQTLSGPISGTSGGINSYGGVLTGGGNLTGAVSGAFFGTNASSTGGVFALVKGNNASYSAIGLFGGNRH
jgi:hypothetical protein